MHSYTLPMCYLSGQPLSQLLSGAAVDPKVIAMTAAPPSSRDNGRPDKH